MEHLLCFNHVNLPVDVRNNAFALLEESLQAALRLNSGEDRYAIYYDVEDQNQILLSEGYLYSDFKRELSGRDVDLFSFILEIEDKVPFLEKLPEEDVEELSGVTGYVPGKGYATNYDIFTYAWLKSGFLLSLGSDDFWRRNTIDLSISFDNFQNESQVSIRNLSRFENADFHIGQAREKIEEVFPGLHFEADFLGWYDAICQNDRDKTKNVIRLCVEGDFRLGRPVIDTLRDSDYQNMKEIRVGNAFGQRGKIRLFFISSADRIIYILLGFIKHSNDYTVQIKQADALYAAIVAQQN